MGMKGFRGRALFNLLQLRYKGQELPSSVESWQVEDYTKLSIAQLFSRLGKLGLSLNEASFLRAAEEVENPESLLQSLASKEESKIKLEIYLVIFELWKKLLPDRKPLSILCDALDHEIERLKSQKQFDSEILQEILLDLQYLFERAVDDGYIPEKVFIIINSYLAHNLEAFLYGYIKNQLDEENETEASEWIDGFYRYVPNKIALDFLKFRLLHISDSHDALKMIDPLIEKILEGSARKIAFDLLEFLSRFGSSEHFIESFKRLVPIIKTEKDFIDMLSIAGDFYQGLDKEIEESQIRDLIASRKDIDPNRKIEIERLLINIFKKKISSNK